MYVSKPVLEINLRNLQHNYESLKSVCKNSAVGSVIKADSYGLGVEKVAPVLLDAGCNHFFVANRDEGIRLRSIIGDMANIYVFLGVFNDEIQEFVEHNLIPVLNYLQQIEIWQQYAKRLQRNLACIINIDIGMNRLGFQASDIALLNLESQAPNLNVLYIMSHLTDAEDMYSQHNVIQLEMFNKLCQRFTHIPKSLANSGGIFLGPEYHFDLIRPGAAIYGLIQDSYRKESIIKPVVSLFAPIVQISSLKPGEKVGYNGTYINQSRNSCLIATIPVGYGDGFSRAFSNKGKVMIREYEAPIIGRVSMDLTVIDVSRIPPHLLFIGQKVEVIGNNLTANQVAEFCSTSDYEIITFLGARYERIYIH